MKADRVYCNRADTRRVRVFKHESGEGWDFDLFRKMVLGGGWDVDAGFLSQGGESPARTLKAALAWAEDQVGALTELRGLQTVTEGWPEREQPKPTKDAAIKIEAGQIWRQGSRRLRVRWVDSTHVGYVWSDPSGRETGTAIRGRKHEQTVTERRFREKFRYVSTWVSP